jgi:Zn-dependent protease with chaperone function
MAMNFFGKQAQARSKTKWLVFYFLLAVIAIVLSVNTASWLLLAMFDARHATSFNIWVASDFSIWISLATIVIIMLGSLLRMAQLSGGGQAVADMVGARRILPETSDPLEKKLVNVVEEMSIASGTAPPRLYVLDTENGINAFVAGTQPQNTVLVITRGALEQLNRNQLQGVIGHEYSHIAHGDMRINIRLLGMLAGILLIGQCGSFILRNLRGGSSSSSDSNKSTAALLVIGLVLMVVGYIGLFFGRLIKAAISRQREFLADAAAVQYTRDNESIAGALAKIGLAPQGALLGMSSAEEMSHMCFGQSVRFSLEGLLATHPSIEARIKALGFTPDVFIRRISHGEKSTEEKNEIPKQKIDPKALFTTVASTMASIGTISEENIQAARKIQTDISESLRSAVHNRLQAPDLLIALLINNVGEDRQAALMKVDQHYGEDRKIAVTMWLSELQSTKPRHRLALLNAMRNTIDFLKEDERIKLVNVLSEIAKIDQKIAPFEFVLLSLVKKWLKPSPAPKGLVRRFIDVSDDLSIVIGLMVMAGGAPKDELQRQYENAMNSFSVPIQSLPRIFDAQRLQTALDSLNRLVPILKKPLMNTLVELAMVDKKLNVDEGELLRAIAEQLGCPIPSLSGNN